MHLLYRRKGTIDRLRGSLLKAQQSAVLRNKHDHNVLPDLLFHAFFTIPDCYQNWKLRGTGRFREDLDLCNKMALSSPCLCHGDKEKRPSSNIIVTSEKQS